MSVTKINNFYRPNILNHNIEKNFKRLLINSHFILSNEISYFEYLVAKKTNFKYAITCSNCTDGIVLCLKALGIKNKVIFIPSFTFCATADSVYLSGNIPFFVDVCQKSFTMDINSLKKSIILALKLNLKIGGIIPVEIFGNPCDCDSINEIAKKYSLFVIIDAAQSFNSYCKTCISNSNTIKVVSFYPTKNFSCFGDGGLILTNNKFLTKLLMCIRNHGKNKTKVNTILQGLNARLDSIQSLVLIEKLKYIDFELFQRRNIANIFNKHLKKEFNVQKTFLNKISAFSNYCILIKNVKYKKNLVKYLKSKNIEVKSYYKIPLHKHKAYKFCYKEGFLTNSSLISNSLISLPNNPYDKKEITYKIIYLIKKFFTLV